METRRTLTVALGVVLLCISGAMADTVTFGSSNDGYGGFVTPTPTGTEVWSLTADSVNYAFGVLSVDEAHTASLLRSYTLDRSEGSAYTIEGVVTLTDGYGDDNNRIGVLLFHDTDTQTADGGGGLWLRLNTDGKNLTIEPGINTTPLDSADALGSYTGDGWIGTTLTYKADIAFTSGNIDVTFTFADQDNVETTLNAVVAAGDYTGTYFGFATKWRQRGSDISDRNVPPVIDYKSFSVAVVPEPATMGLLSLGGLALLRRRRK